MRNTIIGLLLAVFGLATALRANEQPSAAVLPETQTQAAPETSQQPAAPVVKEKKKRRAPKKEKKVESQSKAEPAKANE